MGKLETQLVSIGFAAVIVIAVTACGAGSSAQLRKPPAVKAVTSTPMGVDGMPKELIGVRQDGHLIWASGVAAATADGGVIESNQGIPNQNNSLRAVAPDTHVRWHRTIAPNCLVRAVAVAPDGNSLAACDGTIVALDNHGQERWTIKLKSYLVHGIALAPSGNGYAYVEPAGVGSPTSNDASVVFALTPSGGIRWQDGIDSLAGIDYSGGTDFRVQIGAMALASDGTVYVGTSGNLTALSPDGHKLWQLHMENDTDEILEILVGPNETIYAVGGDTFGGPGFVEALDPDGHPIWMAAVGTRAATSAALGPNGSIYANNPEQVFRVDHMASGT